VTVRIKICGIVHPDDAAAAVDAGADLIGLNSPDSPRKLSLDTAAAISAAVAGRTERVGVFRDATPDEIDRVLRRVDLDRLQFHGNETEAQVEEVDLPVIKAIRGADAEAAGGYPGTILLLDHPDGGARQPWRERRVAAAERIRRSSRAGSRQRGRASRLATCCPGA
jgi:phosphoribosylanthranilate isomerase